MFATPNVNPIKFIESFDSCFSSALSNEVRCVRLLNFVPIVDREKFSSVWIMQPPIMFVEFRRRFIRNYLPVFMQHRRAKLATGPGDYSSFSQFVKDKIDIYMKLDGLSRQLSVERVFLDLPVKIAAKFYEQHDAVTEQRLIDRCTWADLHLKAQFQSAESSFDRLALDTDQNETSSSSSDESIGDDLEKHNTFYDLELAHLVNVYRRFQPF